MALGQHEAVVVGDVKVKFTCVQHRYKVRNRQ